MLLSEQQRVVKNDNQGQIEENTSQETLVRPEAQAPKSPSTSSHPFSSASPASGSARRNPPARNTSRFWFERFLAVIQRQNPSVIDASFLSQIAPSNEGKLLAQLKFLRVIDEQGKPTPLLPTLNLIGEEQKKGFQEIAKSSYADLLNEVKIERAVPDDVVNFFIRRYAFTKDKAINASKFFLYLAEKGSLQVSQELSSFYTEKVTSSSTVSTLSQNAPTTSNAPISARSGELAGRASQRIALAQPLQTRSNKAPRKLNRTIASSDAESALPKIQATIEIKLDKDTPKEYWDRVLALLGETRNNGVEGEVTVQTDPIERQQPQEIEAELVERGS